MLNVKKEITKDILQNAKFILKRKRLNLQDESTYKVHSNFKPIFVKIISSKSLGLIKIMKNILSFSNYQFILRNSYIKLTKM